jgi:hypothetical protein
MTLRIHGQGRYEHGNFQCHHRCTSSTPAWQLRCRDLEGNRSVTSTSPSCEERLPAHIGKCFEPGAESLSEAPSRVSLTLIVGIVVIAITGEEALVLLHSIWRGAERWRLVLSGKPCQTTRGEEKVVHQLPSSSTSSSARVDFFWIREPNIDEKRSLSPWLPACRLACSAAPRMSSSSGRG